MLLSNFNEVEFLYALGYTTFSPRPRLTDNPIALDMVVGDISSPDFTLGFSFNYNVDEKFSIMVDFQKGQNCLRNSRKCLLKRHLFLENTKLLVANRYMTLTHFKTKCCLDDDKSSIFDVEIGNIEECSEKLCEAYNWQPQQRAEITLDFNKDLNSKYSQEAFTKNFWELPIH